MNDVKISLMSEEKLAQVYEIEAASFQTPWSVQSFRDELNNPLAMYLIAEKGNSVVGFIGSWIVFDECHIMNVAVKESERGHGIASKLLKGLLEIAEEKGVKSVFLEVRISNEPAIHLYKKFGFKEYGIRKNYYTDTQEDAVTMCKNN